MRSVDEMPTTYRGTVRNGVVVVDSPAPLAEGTTVHVQPVDSENADDANDSARVPHFHPVGAWDGPPGELDRLLADVQHARDADLDSERDAWE
jgi:hypothetical protein